jgi:methylenetetrahydrofolate reductase (NADPH)
VHITADIATQTTLTPMAHLTCVGHSRDELRSVIGAYAAAGVRNVLALRGDPPEGPTATFEPHPEGLHNAVELVEMTRQLGDFCVGVAAFPEIHPAAESADSDARYLAAKARAGAEFAITQLFFRPADYFALVERVRALGVDIPIIPGIMPITNLAQITRMAELSGAALPHEVVERVARHEGDPAAVRAEGIAIATELCDELLAGGAPGLHFYTLNRSKATREIYAGLRSTVG